MELTINIPFEYIGNIYIVLKMILASLLGGLIGKERRQAEKAAGSRTFALMGLGSCMIAVLSTELLEYFVVNYQIVRYDFGRLLAYGISSIGFLGIGVIIKNKGNIEGVTTACTLWTSVIMGFYIGLDYFFLGTFAAMLIYIILKSKGINGKTTKKLSNRRSK